MATLTRSQHWNPDEDEAIANATNVEVIAWIEHRETRDFSTDLMHRIIFAAQNWDEKTLSIFFRHDVFRAQLRSMVLGYLSIEPSHPFISRLLDEEDFEVDPSVGWKKLPVAGYAPVDVPEKRRESIIWFAGENILLLGALKAGNIDLSIKLLSHPKVFLHLSGEKQQKKIRKEIKLLDDAFFYTFMQTLFEKKLVTSTFTDPFEALRVIFSRPMPNDENLLFTLFAQSNGEHLKELKEIETELMGLNFDIQQQLEAFDSSHEPSRKRLQEIDKILNVYNYTETFNVDKIVLNVIREEFFDIYKIFDPNLGLQATEFVKQIFRICLRSLANSLFFHDVKKMAIEKGVPVENFDWNKVVTMIIFADDLEMLLYLNEMMDLKPTFKLASDKFDKGIRSGKMIIPEWQFSTTMKDIHPALTALVLQRFEIFGVIVDKFGIPDMECQALGVIAEEFKQNLFEEN